MPDLDARSSTELVHFMQNLVLTEVRDTKGGKIQIRVLN